MTTIEGACHCGNIEFEIETAKAPGEIVARACDCSFCRMHATRNWSDPEGRARLVVHDRSKLNRYRFGQRSIDFYICRDCGGYAGAVLSEPAGRWASLNLRLTAFKDAPEAAMSYEAQSVAERTERRKCVWTPVEVVVDGTGT